MTGLTCSLDILVLRPFKKKRPAEMAEHLCLAGMSELAQRCVRLTRPGQGPWLEWYREVLETTQGEVTTAKNWMLDGSCWFPLRCGELEGA